MASDPFQEAPTDPNRAPFDANQALPTLVFVRHRKRLEQLLPTLHVHTCRFVSLFAYPLSGGFRSWSLLPAALAPKLLRLEDKLAPRLGRWLGFRLLVVCSKA